MKNQPTNDRRNKNQTRLNVDTTYTKKNANFKLRRLKNETYITLLCFVFLLNGITNNKKKNTKKKVKHKKDNHKNENQKTTYKRYKQQKPKPNMFLQKCTYHKIKLKF